MEGRDKCPEAWEYIPFYAEPWEADRIVRWWLAVWEQKMTGGLGIWRRA